MYYQDSFSLFSLLFTRIQGQKQASHIQALRWSRNSAERESKDEAGGGKEGEGVGAGTEEEEREVAGEKGIEFGISLLVSVQLNRQLHTKRCSGPWLFSCPSPRSTVWAARTFLEHLWIFFQGRWIQMAVFIQRKLSCLCTIRSSQQIKSSRWRHQDMLNLDMSKAAVAL